MAENIPIEKTVYDKLIYPKVIDTEFNQLLNQQGEEETEFTLDEFFTYGKPNDISMIRKVKNYSWWSFE